jgi:hypothetical protein
MNVTEPRNVRIERQRNQIEHVAVIFGGLAL